jgi:hypothetical protein
MGMESQGDQSQQTPAQGATTTPPAQGSGERRMTDAEWRQSRRTQLADAELNDLVKKVIDLEATNFKLRQRETPEGGKALTPDELKEWDAYRALGKPAELSTLVTDGRNAITERDQMKREKESTELATIGKADATVLQDRLTANGLSAVKREVQKDGKPEQIVMLQDASGKDVGELSEYAAANWKVYVPALFPQGGTQTQTPAPQTSGTVITGQAGAGNGAAPVLSAVEARIQARTTAATTPAPQGGTT